MLGFKLVSSITLLRVEPNVEEFAHIISGRKQVYITNLDQLSLQTFFTLTYNNHEHHIFISYDEPLCFICKEKGHRSAYCQKFKSLQDRSVAVTDNELVNSQSLLVTTWLHLQIYRQKRSPVNLKGLLPPHPSVIM